MANTENENKTESKLVYVQKLQIKNKGEDQLQITVRTDKKNIIVVETVEPVFSE